MKLLERSARTYLASNLQKTVFAEHAIDEDDGKKGKKKGPLSLLSFSDCIRP